MISAGVCFGKFTHNGKFRLQITCLDYLAQYATVCIHAFLLLFSFIFISLSLSSFLLLSFSFRFLFFLINDILTVQSLDKNNSRELIRVWESCFKIWAW